jgi:Cu(I)/Ag(I) efflux system membrane fusion protein
VKEAHGYRPVEVETGQERDGYTEILSGLSEGEEVVASGQFLIDSEASLSGVLARLSKQDEMDGMAKDMSGGTDEHTHLSSPHEEKSEDVSGISQ